MKSFFKFLKYLVILVVIVILVFSIKIFNDGKKLYKSKIEEKPIATKIEEIRNKENYVTYENIPKTYINAMVSIEDHRFYKHKGVDIQSILRAVVTDIAHMSLVEGGSTLTQQLAKNMYYSQEKSFVRKVAEAITATEIEKNYSKEDILELYANVVYFGSGYYGIYDASMGYFNKKPNELNLDEITMLAGLPNAPSVYSLNNKTELSVQRQNMVIDAMVKYDFLSKEEVDKLKNYE